MMKKQTRQIGSPVYDQVLALLRSALWGEERFPYQAPQDVEWKDIIQELKNQTVQYLVIDLLIRERPEKADGYFAATAKNMMRLCNLLEVQQTLCQQLSEAGIPCVVVKGAAAAVAYPQPNNRLIGDIDLLVKPEDFETACQLVSRDARFLEENHRHREYKMQDMIVEIHRTFSTLNDPQKRELSDQRIFGGIDAGKIAWLDDYSFRCLPHTEHALVLLEHISLHLEGGIGLRQILDWMMLADKVLDDRAWNAEFAPIVRELGLETLAVTVTRMCQMYLGLREDITWCNDADEMLCQELMEYVLKQGNFGRKLQKGSNRAVTLLGANDLRTFFRILQYYGCSNWKAVKRYPILKPFAWLYQLVRYIIQGLRTKHPIQFLRTATKRAKTKGDFLEALGVRRKSEECQER